MRTEQELLQTKRMYYYDYDHPSNNLIGFDQMVSEIVKPDYLVVEVGSFSGVSSEYLAKNCKDLVCVDIWDLPCDEYTEMPPSKRKKALQMFLKVKKEYPNIKMIKGLSTEVAKMFKNHSIDMVYIDAAHDYESVRNDILAWKPKVKNGGYICGHDILLEPVRNAVISIFGEYFKEYPDQSWVIQKI